MSDLPLALVYENVFYYSQLVSPHFANLIDLKTKGISVPPGFLITHEAHNLFLESNALPRKLSDLSQTHSLNSPEDVLSIVNSMSGHSKNSSHHPVLRDILKLNLAILEKSGQVDFITDKLLIRDSLGNNQVLEFNLDSILNFIKQSYTSWYTPVTLTQGQPPISFLLQVISNVSYQGTIESGISNPHEFLVNINNQQFKLNRKQAFVEGELTNLLNSVQINDLVNLVDKISGHYYLPQEIYFYISENTIYFLDSKDASIPINPVSKPQQIDADIPTTKPTSNEQSTPVLDYLVNTPSISPIVRGRVRLIRNHRDLNLLKHEEIAIISNSRYISPILTSIKPRAIIFVGKLDALHRSKIKNHRVPFAQVPRLPLEKKHHRYVAKLQLGVNTLSF